MDHRSIIAGQGWALWDRHGHRWTPETVLIINEQQWSLITGNVL